jgi:Galactose oxidase, central domain
MLKVPALSLVLGACATACFNPPDTELTSVGTTDIGTTGATTTEVDTLDTSSSSVGPTTEPDTTISPPDSTSSDSGETLGEDAEIEVSIDGRVIAAGDSFALPDAVPVGELGPAVTVTVENTGGADLHVGGVLVMGPDIAHVALDQAGLAATIAGGESSTFTVTFTPQNGGIKDVVLSIASDDADENPYDIAFTARTPANTYHLIEVVDGPSGRFNAALEDLGDGRLLLFGGRDAAGAWLSDTWIFDVEASSWTELVPALSPPPRNAHDMARVDASTVVMFGGTAATGGGALADTWSFDIATEAWSSVSGPMPPPRFQHGMVAIGGSLALLYGGRTSIGMEIGDTWIFDAGALSWSNVAPPGAPPTNSAFAFAFDGADTVTMFGGFQNNIPLDQTWNYTVSTNSWVAATPAGSPGARAVLGGEYLAAGQMVVFSGKLGECCVNPSSGTFAYDPIADSWSTITPPGEPSPRFSYAIAPVAGEDKMILFGGLLANTGVATALAETWEYVGP